MSDTCSVCGGKLHRDEVFGEHTSPLDCVDVMRARLDAAEAERDKLRKRSTERRVQVTDLYGNLSLENDRLCTKLAAVEDDVMEIAKVLYFGFMICESQCGRAEVRIKFADLKYAQRLHSILVKIQNKRDIHDEAAKGGRDGTPEGLRTELLKCPRPVLVWVLELVQRLAAAEAAMKAAASLPGEMWLTGQLALAEFLTGEGGEHLNYALEQYEQYEAAKEGRDEF